MAWEVADVLWPDALGRALLALRPRRRARRRRAAALWAGLRRRRPPRAPRLAADRRRRRRLDLRRDLLHGRPLDRRRDPDPVAADVGYLLFPPLTLAGIWSLLRTRARACPARLWVDGITAALARRPPSAPRSSSTTVHDAVSGQALEVAVGLAYPLTDLVLLGVVVGALAGTGWRLDRTWVLLAARRRLLLARRLALPRRQRQRHLRRRARWFDIGWWLGLVADRRRRLAAAAARAAAPARRAPAPRSCSRSSSASLGLGAARLRLPRASVNAARRRPRRRLAARASWLRALLTFRENVAMLRASRDEALTDALTGLGNRRALARELEHGRSGARPPRSRSCSRSSTSTASSTTTTPSATRPATRCSSASARSLRGLPRRPRHAPSGWAATSSARCSRPGPSTIDAARRRRGDGALRARRGLRDRLLLRRDHAARRGGRRRRGAAHRRPAHVRAEERRAAPRPAARARTCCCARSPSATPSSATTSSDVADLAEATARRLGLAADAVERGPPRRRAARRRQGRRPGRDPRQARPARRGRVGVHPPPHADRRADHRRRAGADAASPRSCAPATSAGTARGYPDGLAGEDDPARRAHRRRRRRLRRDDRRAPVPHAAHARRGARRAAPLRRHAVRPRRRRRVLRRLGDRAPSPPPPERPRAPPESARTRC